MSATQFLSAILRAPSASVVEGIRDEGSPAPDASLFARQHDAYHQTLQRLGLDTLLLPAQEDFPDSVFVEDTALCFDDFAILLRPGAASRAGETESIYPALFEFYHDILWLEDGHVDGGDVLWTGPEVIIGVSNRTTEQGAQELQRLLSSRGIEARIAQTPPGILHFKSACALVAPNTILADPALSDTGVFANYSVIDVPETELPAANAIRIGDTVLLPSGFPVTRDLLESRGIQVWEVDNSEPGALNGGLSCMSLRLPVSRKP